MENKEVRHNPNIEEEKKHEKLPLIFRHIVNNFLLPVDAILNSGVSENFIKKHPLQDFEKNVQKNLNKGIISKEQFNILLSNSNFIEKYNCFIEDFSKVCVEGKINENHDRLIQNFDEIKDKIEEEKVPADFGLVIPDSFSAIKDILENSISKKSWNKDSIQLKDFKTMVQENLDKGKINKEQARLFIIWPNFGSEYDNFVNDFNKAIEEEKLKDKREDLTNKMNNILDKIKVQKI